MKVRSTLLLVAAAVFALMTVGFTSAALAQKVTGAIFTTDRDSTFVNGNVYDTAQTLFDINGNPLDKTAPYLNGGPRPNAPCTAAGLPSDPGGTYYYFQVTDPSGKVLLSSDPITNRQVTVNDGLIMATAGTHDTGIGKCNVEHPGNKSVELFPFHRTPNPGGEYKVWMTKVNDYVSCDLNNNPAVSSSQVCQGSFGFVPSTSKTDNFKVVDYDGDNIPDSEDACPDDFSNGCVPPPDSTPPPPA